jgi:signal transduction histidine kinase
MGDQGIQAASLAKASRALVKMGQAEKARKISEKAIAIADSSGQPFNMSQANASMGYLLLTEEKWKKAIPFYESAFEAVKDADIFTPNIGMLYKELSSCYENTGSYSKALNLYKQYSVISDSVWSKENIQKATEMAMNFEFEKKEQFTKARQAAKDEIAHTRQLALIIGLVLSFIIIIGALFAFYQKQKAHALLRQQKKEIETTLTKLKDTQSQLIQSEKMASLGELTAGIAHEIQNPLNFVNNFSEVSNELIDEMNEEIAKGDLDEAKIIASDVKQNLEKIHHHGKRAEAIVKGMLQHSRSSSRAKEPTDINALADEYLRLAYHGLRAKDKSFNAKIETDFDEDIGQINVVAQNIGRVVLNLITNAFYTVKEKKQEHPEDYEPTVFVSTKKLGNQIEINVKDNGKGITDEVKDKILQPFFTTKPAGQGTGLGLSLSYDIIKAHGGKLQIETTEGEGSIFTIIIPETI